MTDSSLRPNLFVIGAMKSGTTSLHAYLDAHPAIFMTQDPWKEPAYFVEELNWSKGSSWYAQLFEAGREATIRGESSTDYTKFPMYRGTPERIARHAPDAKLIYVMRDPVERSISHYWWEVQWSAEGRDMLTAAKKVDGVRDVSNYALQLRQYLPIFGRERILPLTMEEMSQNPERTVATVFNFLGVDDSFVPANLRERRNVSPEKMRRVAGSGVFSHLRGGALWKTAKLVVPAAVRRRMIQTLSRPVERDDKDKGATIEYLRSVQRDQVAELSELLGRTFPEWKTLYGSDA